MRRRDFLLVTTSVSAVMSVAARARSVFKSEDAAVERPNAVLYEPKYQASRDFALQLIERGAHPFSTHDCIVAIWRGPLERCLAQRKPRIAGLTLYSDFLIMRECARERGLRVIREDLRQCEAPSCVDGSARSVTLVSWVMGN
jgi:hypothetical protein